jgi:hypothetical protein
MPRKVYFDTVSFRHVGCALQNAALPDDLRDYIVVSPLSAFEVLSQLTIVKGDEVLKQIQAIHHWVNPKRTVLLPWPDDALANIGFGKPMGDDDFTPKMEKAFNVCLNATSAAPLQEEAGKLKDTMDAMKLRTAQDFARLLDVAKKESPKDDWFSEAWFQGIAKRTKADPKSKTAKQLADAFSAYHEFERVKLETALQSNEYNAEKHQNDLLDAEQLIYLGDPELNFLTCDNGFKRVSKSPQSKQIVVVSQMDLVRRWQGRNCTEAGDRKSTQTQRLVNAERARIGNIGTGNIGTFPNFLFMWLEKIPRGRRLWNPTLRKRPRKDGAPSWEHSVLSPSFT